MSLRSFLDGVRSKSSTIDAPVASGQLWLWPAAILAAFVALLPLARTSAQEVVKPTGTTTVSTQRLPAPQGVTVRQTGSTITLTWNAVAGAKYYVLGRAVGTEGFRRLLDASTGPDTAYVDPRITIGVKHVYTVTPISAADISGLRATSDSIVPTATTTTTTTTTSPASSASIVARLMGTADIGIQWTGTGGFARYYLRHVRDGVPMTPVALTENQLVERNVAPGRRPPRRRRVRRWSFPPRPRWRCASARRCRSARGNGGRST